MEYCPYGNMSEFLRNRREIYEPDWLQLTEDHDSKLSITDLVETASQIASGMEFLASRKVFYIIIHSMGSRADALFCTFVYIFYFKV
jgi:serine/threonine protein kinase